MTSQPQARPPSTGDIQAALEAQSLHAYADGYMLSLGGGEPVTFGTLSAAARGLIASRWALAELRFMLTGWSE